VGKVEKVFEVLELRAAVVEAARKAAAAWRGNRVGLASMFAAVTETVDALERAEKERT
jgi:hypothetical protein